MISKSGIDSQIYKIGTAIENGLKAIILFPFKILGKLLDNLDKPAKCMSWVEPATFYATLFLINLLQCIFS